MSIDYYLYSLNKLSKFYTIDMKKYNVYVYFVIDIP